MFFERIFFELNKLIYETNYNYTKVKLPFPKIIFAKGVFRSNNFSIVYKILQATYDRTS